MKLAGFTRFHPTPRGGFHLVRCCGSGIRTHRSLSRYRLTAGCLAIRRIPHYRQFSYNATWQILLPNLPGTEIDNDCWYVRNRTARDWRISQCDDQTHRPMGCFACTGQSLCIGSPTLKPFIPNHYQFSINSCSHCLASLFLQKSYNYLRSFTDG